jgi:hypothetical protein
MSNIRFQKENIMAALRGGRSLSTFDIRAMDIHAPAARINELRRAGYNIASTWGYVNKPNGQRGKFAIYSLLNSPKAA